MGEHIKPTGASDERSVMRSGPRSIEGQAKTRRSERIGHRLRIENGSETVDKTTAPRPWATKPAAKRRVHEMATENTAPSSTNPTEFSPCEEAWDSYLGTPAEDRRRPEFDSFLAWALHEFDGDLIWPDVDDPSWADCPDEVDTVPWWGAGIELLAPLSGHDTQRFLAAAAACDMQLKFDEDDDLLAFIEDRVDRDANGGWDAWRLAEWERAHGRPRVASPQESLLNASDSNAASEQDRNYVEDVEFILVPKTASRVGTDGGC